MLTTFFHDVPDEVVAQIMAGEGGEGPADSLFVTPFDRPAWPECRPPCWPAARTGCSRTTSRSGWPRERLGLAVEPLPGGHLVALSQPAALAERLLAGPASPSRRPPPGEPWASVGNSRRKLTCT